MTEHVRKVGVVWQAVEGGLAQAGAKAVERGVSMMARVALAKTAAEMVAAEMVLAEMEVLAAMAAAMAKLAAVATAGTTDPKHDYPIIAQADSRPV